MAAPSTVLDPVVIEALEDLSAMVNHGNNLAGVLDKRDAVVTLTTLYRGGHRLQAETIYAWATNALIDNPGVAAYTSDVWVAAIWSMYLRWCSANSMI